MQEAITRTCEYCSYPNEHFGKNCEVCGELLTSLPEPSKIVECPASSPSLAIKEKDEKVIEISGELIEEVKVYDKEIKGSETHICIREDCGIYCMICREMMVFQWLRGIPYPAEFPESPNDKIALLEKTFGAEELVELLMLMNGIVNAAEYPDVIKEDDEEIEMAAKDLPSIMIEISGQDIIYSGPSRARLNALYERVLEENKQIMIPLSIQGQDEELAFVVMSPSTHVYCIRFDLPYYFNSDVESYICKLTSNLGQPSKHSKFIQYSWWSLEFTRSYIPVYYKLINKKNSIILTLVMITLISSGMSITKIADYLHNQEVYTFDVLIMTIVERTITAFL